MNGTTPTRLVNRELGKAGQDRVAAFSKHWQMGCCESVTMFEAAGWIDQSSNRNSSDLKT